MIDLIIPVYNNWYELLETLRSCGRFFKREDLLITIVDDASTNITDDQYETLPSTFPHLRFQILRLRKNRGPGYARQYAIEHTHNPYIIFIDSGDVWISIFTLPNYINFIKQNPELYLCVPGYLYELPDKTMKVQQHQQFHGVMMAREFIDKYNLKIPISFSYMGEDTSYLPLCHLLAKQENKFISLENDVFVFHTYNQTSLVNHKTGDYYYKTHCRSFIMGATEIIETHTNLDLSEYIGLILIYGYAILIDCQFYNPKFYNENLKIYSKFYHQYGKPLLQTHAEQFFHQYNQLLIDLVMEKEFDDYYVFDIKTFFKSLE